MKYKIHEVDIFVFDVHTALRPLAVEGYMQEQLNFLVDEDLYVKLHLARQTLDVNGFKIRPLTYNSRQYNHFWRNYMKIWHEGGRNLWNLQVPFICEPAIPRLKVRAANSPCEVIVRPTVYLSALGWSTNLSIRLVGNMTPEQVRDMVGVLRSKDGSGAIFELEGRRQNLSGVFRYFSERVREILYKPRGNMPEIPDKTNIHRHFIISLTNYSGPVAYYKNKWWDNDARMTNADQAALHSILHGRPIDVKEFAYITRSNKYSVIHFAGPDLALSYFDLGSLVFLQRSASNSKRKVAMRCLASNIRSCLMQTFSFLYFYSNAKKRTESSQRIEKLLVHLKKNLQCMPENYTNRFCERLYNNHAELKAIRSDLYPTNKC